MAGAETPAAGERAYTVPQLQNVLHGGMWRLAGPNRPHPQDFDPYMLSATGIDRIAQALLVPQIAGPAASRPGHPDNWSEAPETLTPGGDLGTLTKAGSGKSRICYDYEHGGRHMAVLFGPYDAQLGIQVPESPRLTLTNDLGARRLWSYSDLHTYLVLPIGRTAGIYLQEWGGSARPDTGLGRMVAGLGRAVAQRRARQYLAFSGLKDIGPDFTTSRLAKHEHYLFKPGSTIPSLINVPAEQRAD